MALIDNVKRIIVEDFPEEDRRTAALVAEYYNYFAEEVTDAINGRLNYDNMANKSIKTIDVQVTENGTPIVGSKFSSEIGLRGITVLRAQNVDNRAIYATNQPFVSYEPSGTGIYTIRNITGLPENQKFRLTLELSF